MSDAEEPPTKMSKYEEYLDENVTDAEDCFDEGQEEWLSEGVLTDDEYNMTGNDRIDSQSDDTTMEEQDSIKNIENTEAVETKKGGGIKPEKTDQNIEDTLNNLDNGNDLPKDLETFLIRRPGSKVTETTATGEKIKMKENIEDDGNDTDDLLRLLGDDQQKKKKTLKMVKSQDDQDTTDDEFIYDRSTLRTLKIAKNALIKKVPTKAVPEDMSDSDGDETDASSEGFTMKKIFGLKEVIPKRELKGKPKKSNNSNNGGKTIKINDNKQQNNANGNASQPIQKGILKTTKSKSDMKIMKAVEIKLPASLKKLQNKVTSQKTTGMRNTDPDEDVKEESEEIIDEEEFLEGDDFDLDEEEFGDESEGDMSRQRIMRPERMDEEIPSDDDSQSEDGSIYDELPSSDSEDFDDWFTLDIRAETASDYLPLLGKSAHSLLMAEKRRATERVTSLRTSLSALTESARRQADALRNAAMALAEIDDTLRAA